LALLQQEVEEIRQTAESEIMDARAAVDGIVEAVDGEIRDTQAMVEDTVEAVDGEINDTQTMAVGAEESIDDENEDTQVALQGSEESEGEPEAVKNGEREESEVLPVAEEGAVSVAPGSDVLPDTTVAVAPETQVQEAVPTENESDGVEG
jgi:hypothetical protein